MLRYKGEETSLNAFSKLAQRQAPFDKLDLFTQYMVVYLSFKLKLLTVRVFITTLQRLQH